MAGVPHTFFLNLIFLLTIVLCTTEHTEKGHNLLLSDKNWNQMLEGEWMVKFYAPWCPACRAMEETWNDFAKWAALNDGHNIKVGSVDVTSEPALNGRFMITALPTIYHVINGEFRQYTSARDLDDFKEFINSNGWKEINPVSSWTSPTSFMMSSVSKLFSFSMELKSYHNTLNSDYGFPTWLSMLLFGLLIITIGLLLGMVLVLASDYFWGPPQYDDAIFKKEVDANNLPTEKDSVKEINEETASSQLESEQPSDINKEENDEESSSDDGGSNLRQRKVKTGDEGE